MTNISPIWFPRLRAAFQEASLPDRIFMEDLRITTGCPLFQSKPVQPEELKIKTGQDLQALCEKFEDDFNHQAFDMMSSMGVDPKSYEITPARVKKNRRIKEKVQGLGDEGSVSTITDGLAMTIWAKDLDVLERITDHLRPSHNPLVTYFEDSIHRPNIKTGLPRIQALSRILGSGGLIGETLVMPFPLKGTYDATRELHNKVRKIKALYGLGDKLPQNKLNEMEELEAERTDKMQRGIRRAKLSSVMETHTYYEINGELSAYTYAQKGRRECVLHFDPVSGFVEKDKGRDKLAAIKEFGPYRLGCNTLGIRRLSGPEEFIRLAAEQRIEALQASKVSLPDAHPIRTLAIA